MSVGAWYIEKNEAQSEYDINRIDRDAYERRTKFAIGMIYKHGNQKDKEAAKSMSKRHGYNIDELVEIVS